MTNNCVWRVWSLNISNIVFECLHWPLFTISNNTLSMCYLYRWSRTARWKCWRRNSRQPSENSSRSISVIITRYRYSFHHLPSTSSKDNPTWALPSLTTCQPPWFKHNQDSVLRVFIIILENIVFILLFRHHFVYIQHVNKK
jgi:hypothetical protein